LLPYAPLDAKIAYKALGASRYQMLAFEQGRCNM
jgi:hypothetical protein